jgi:hypothetical protein
MHHLHGLWHWAAEWALFIVEVVRGLFRRDPPDGPDSDGPTILQFRLQ